MIFQKEWIFVGHAARLCEPGSYFTVDLVTVPIIVCKGQDGVLRAFANSCRHRGTRLVNGEGKARNFICPYHAWTYETTGTLRGAPGMDGVNCFEKAEDSLTPVRLETLGPFMWVNFDAGAPSLLRSEEHTLKSSQ